MIYDLLSELKKKKRKRKKVKGEGREWRDQLHEPLYRPALEVRSSLQGRFIYFPPISCWFPLFSCELRPQRASMTFLDFIFFCKYIFEFGAFLRSIYILVSIVQLRASSTEGVFKKCI